MKRRHTPKQEELNLQLIDALIHNDTETALALVNAGADPNTRYEPISLPVYETAYHPLFDTSERTVDYSATAFVLACGDRFEPLHFEPISPDELDEKLPLLQAMLAVGADVHDLDIQGSTALHYAVGANRWHRVELLLKYGANINAQDNEGCTPLILAAAHKHENMVRLLLAQGAKPNDQDKYGFSALRYAIWGRYPMPIVSELLAYGADPNLKDNDGLTPLMKAQQYKPRDLVRLLKLHGAK